MADPPDPFANDVTAIRARHIITVNSGIITNGIVLIRNGKIVSVGTDVKIPVGATVLVCDTVMPGIVGLSSQIGLSNAPVAEAPPAGRGGPPGQFGGGARTAAANPHYKVTDELYPFDEAWAKLAREGVTTLVLVPNGVGIPGQGAIIKPTGESVQAMTLTPSGVLAVHFAANTQTMDLIRTTFEGARPQQADPGDDPLSDFLPDGAPRPGSAAGDTQVRRGQGRGGVRPGGPGGPATGNQQARQEPVLKAYNGTIPTIINCPDNASVAYALPLFAAFDKLDPIYVLPALDSNRVAALMGEKARSVVLSASIKAEPLTTNRVNVVAEFVRAGSKVACIPQTDDLEGYRTLRYQMGQLVKGGLDPDAAISAITLYPAQMLGISTRVGSVAVGRDANLLLLDGGPFEPTTRIRKVLIDGKVAYDGE
jgi:hypothetical protein